MQAVLRKKQVPATVSIVFCKGQKGEISACPPARAGQGAGRAGGQAAAQSGLEHGHRDPGEPLPAHSQVRRACAARHDIQRQPGCAGPLCCTSCSCPIACAGVIAAALMPTLPHQWITLSCEMQAAGLAVQAPMARDKGQCQGCCVACPRRAGCIVASRRVKIMLANENHAGK